ncbi:hypothetical protein MG293_003866 [Ovis ammon polii]|uniref:Uncharacterized protein n=1 Tax=Ovis ammon polii TaxID=230172 RepID=A0AAD4UJQ1_OVIAM|nr:hypothetical protein MG293_003866 [Ovis ammon polii]KAI4577463.1 hypothetical protein MJT46_003298 [Ovis ammon polii x Ovis aries]
MSTEQGLRARETMTPDAAVAFLVTSGKTQNQRIVTPAKATLGPQSTKLQFLEPKIRDCGSFASYEERAQSWGLPQLDKGLFFRKSSLVVLSQSLHPPIVQSIFGQECLTGSCTSPLDPLMQWIHSRGSVDPVGPAMDIPGPDMHCDACSLGAIVSSRNGAL